MYTNSILALSRAYIILCYLTRLTLFSAVYSRLNSRQGLRDELSGVDRGLSIHASQLPIHRTEATRSDDVCISHLKHVSYILLKTCSRRCPRLELSSSENMEPWTVRAKWLSLGRRCDNSSGRKSRAEAHQNVVSVDMILILNDYCDLVICICSIGQILCNPTMQTKKPSERTTSSSGTENKAIEGSLTRRKRVGQSAVQIYSLQ